LLVRNLGVFVSSRSRPIRLGRQQAGRHDAGRQNVQ